MAKAVKDEKETKRRLLESAKKEFLEKGYLQASLRNICKNAGVTTGALYFFFEGKEALFAELVEEPLQILKKIMLQHYEDEMQQITTAEQQKKIIWMMQRLRYRSSIICISITMRFSFL